MAASRNAPCPCGSGRKYKRCCLDAAQKTKRTQRFEAEVGRRMQDWATSALTDELDLALEQFLASQADPRGDGRSMSDADMDLFSAWFHNDRPLPEGDTPAERYARRPDLDADERAVAGRIASARLSVHRVTEAGPGEWIELEDLDGNRVTVASAKVSREATRWDLLIGRVMAGDPPSLWGSTRLVEPSDEAELMAELARLGGGTGSSPDDATIRRALEDHPLEVLRFRPAGWDIEPTFFTLEGDPVAEAWASWQTPDPVGLERRLRRLGQLQPDEEPEINITVARDLLVGERGELPPGALVLEEAADGALDVVPIATLRLDGEHLILEAMSEQRLCRAIEIVEDDFGALVISPKVNVVPIEERLAEPPEDDARAGTGLDDATERELLEAFLTDRMRRWLDDPHPKLDGLTPRQAASGSRRAEVVPLVRAIENGVDRTRRRGEPGADLRWLRRELGIEDLLAA